MLHEQLLRPTVHRHCDSLL